MICSYLPHIRNARSVHSPSLQAAGAASKKKMRSEMQTSVIEKRRYGQPAQQDYFVPRAVATPANAFRALRRQDA